MELRRIENFTKKVKYNNQWYLIKCENIDSENSNNSNNVNNNFIKVTFIEAQKFNVYNEIWFPGEFDNRYNFIKYYSIDLIISNFIKIYYHKEFYIELTKWLLDDYLQEKKNKEITNQQLNELETWDGVIK